MGESYRTVVCKGIEDDTVDVIFHAKGVAIMVLLCGVLDLCLRGLFVNAKVSTTRKIKAF
jgi:hypothetical protein